MWILLVPLLLLSALAALVGFVSATSAQARLKQRGLWITYGILLAISLCPTLWHYQWTLHYAANYGVYAPGEPVGSYPGLARFRLVVPIAALALWALAWLASRRFPWIGALVPAAAFVGYMRALTWVMENPPGVMLDKGPNISLFLLSAAATIGLITFALAVWGPPFRNSAE